VHILIVASMPTNEIGKLYTFARLSGVEQYGQVVIGQLDRDIGDIWTVPSIVELPYESFELVVLKSCSLLLKYKLNNMFPCCDVDLNYDPTQPSTASLERFGSNVAKFLAEESFARRAKEVYAASPLAAEYYRLKCGEDTVEFKAFGSF
jgi:hypothetical protein